MGMKRRKQKRRREEMAGGRSDGERDMNQNRERGDRESVR